MSGQCIIEMHDLSVHNSPKLNSPRGKSAGDRLAWQANTTRKPSETNRAVNTAVTVITDKLNRTRLSNASAAQSNRNRSTARSNRSNKRAIRSNRTRSSNKRATRSNRTRSSNTRATRSTQIRRSNAIASSTVAELETKRSETNADAVRPTRTQSSNTNVTRSKRTPLLITKSTWTGRARLSPIVEFHNHKHGHSGSASNATLSEETKDPETSAMQSNWTLSPNTSVTASKSRLVRMSPVVEFDNSEHGSAPITRATRCEREKSKQQSTCFMENHLLHQLRRLFSKICDEHKKSRGSDDDLEVLRTHVRQVESHLADVRDLKPDRDNFNQQLTNQCAVFVDLNSKAVAACIEFRSRSRL